MCCLATQGLDRERESFARSPVLVAGELAAAGVAWIRVQDCSKGSPRLKDMQSDHRDRHRGGLGLSGHMSAIRDGYILWNIKPDIFDYIY